MDKEKLLKSEASKEQELDALYELHDFWEDNDVVREHHGLTLDKAKANFDLIENTLKIVNTFQSELKLCATVFYDEIGDCDRASYYLIFKNNKKEYISPDLFRALKPILGVNYE